MIKAVRGKIGVLRWRKIWQRNELASQDTFDEAQPGRESETNS